MRTLRNAFASGRIAQAYMLTGVRGVGKTTTARLIARALNYEAPGASGPTLDMAAEGVHCRAILESRHLDVVEMDAASHTGIDDIRELIDSAHYKPNTARYKVYIIDEVHMLSKQAFNGLLKTLEEPPDHVKFIFATTEARKVPVTVLSRCQRFDLKRIESGELATHLASVIDQEGAAAEQGALALIARAAEGSVRDALSILDRAIAFGFGQGRGRRGARAAWSCRQGAHLRSARDGVEGRCRRRAVATRRAQSRRRRARPSDHRSRRRRSCRHPRQGSRHRGAAIPRRARPSGLAPSILPQRLSMPALARAWQMLLKGHEEVRASPRPLGRRRHGPGQARLRLRPAAAIGARTSSARRRVSERQGGGPFVSACAETSAQASSCRDAASTGASAASDHGRAGGVGGPGPAGGRRSCRRASQLRRRGGFG